MKYLFTRKSANPKTGPMPVTTTEPKSCPQSCPLKDGGCYAENWPLKMIWERAINGISLTSLCNKIAALPDGQIWRMNQAGDLGATAQGNIWPFTLKRLVDANHGKRGFTYTHHNTGLKGNRDLIASANRDGFTINLSGNSLGHADKLKALGIAPVVVVLPAKTKENLYTPAGNRVVICPAITGRSKSCVTCQLCAVASRETIIGFPAHGNRKLKAERMTGE